MKRIYSIFMALALTCVSTIAWAQSHDAAITSDPENDYFSGEVSFDIPTIVSELGVTDEAALAALINAETPSSVYIKTEEGMSNAYTGNANEFWMNSSGVAQAYNDEGTCWYAGIYYDEATTDEETQEEIPSKFYVKVGQMPNYFKTIYEESNLSTVFYLVNGDTKITFNISLKVNAAEEGQAVYLSELNIVKDYEMTLEFTEGKSYEGKTYSATLEGIYDALGTTSEEFDADVANHTYIQTVISVTDETTQTTTYELIDSLSLPTDAAADGWLGRYSNWDETEGKDVYLPINAPKEWSAGCTVYTNTFKLAEGEFSLVSGQYPSTLVEGDTDYTYLYIVNGSNAARVKVQLEVKKPEVIDPDEWVEIGDTTIVQSTKKILDYFQINSELINITEIASLLEVEDPQDITFYHWPTSGEGFDKSLSDGWGAWLNADGNYVAWGENARIMAAYDISGEDTKVYSLSTLQMAGTLKAGDQFKFPVFLANETAGKYYTLNLEYTIQASGEAIPQSQWVKSGQLDYEVQLIPSATAYLLDQKTEVDLEYVKKVMEVDNVDDLVLYGDCYYASESDINPDSVYTKKLTLTPEGGFWMKGANGKLYPTGWGDADAMGMDWQNSGAGLISWYNKPGTRSVGDTYFGNFYLVDEENGKYVRISCDIEFVEEIGPEIEALGSSDMPVVISDDNVDDEGLYMSTAIDWEPICTALGVTTDDIETLTWMVSASSTKFMNFGTAADFYGEEATMDINGYWVDVNSGGSSDDVVFAIGYSQNGYLTFSLLDETYGEDYLYTTKCAVKSDAGYWVFNMAASSESVITGITGISKKAQNGKIYDITGREVTAPTKGLYIQNGKKFIVK